MDFLQLAGKTILVFGVANRKSVAYHIARTLEEAGAGWCTWSATNRCGRAGRAGGRQEIYVCDVEQEEQIERLRTIGRPRREAPRPGPLDRLRRFQRTAGSRSTKRASGSSCRPWISPASR